MPKHEVKTICGTYLDYHIKNSQYKDYLVGQLTIPWPITHSLPRQQLTVTESPARGRMVVPSSRQFPYQHDFTPATTPPLCHAPPSLPWTEWSGHGPQATVACHASSSTPRPHTGWWQEEATPWLQLHAQSPLSFFQFRRATLARIPNLIYELWGCSLVTNVYQSQYIALTFWHIRCRLPKHLVQQKVCGPNKSSTVHIHNMASTMACGIKSLPFGSLKCYCFEWIMNFCQQKQKRKAFR